MYLCMVPIHCDGRWITSWLYNIEGLWDNHNNSERTSYVEGVSDSEYHCFITLLRVLRQQLGTSMKPDGDYKLINKETIRYHNHK